MPIDGKRRLFFALWPSAAAAAALDALIARARPLCGGRATHRSDLHLTLAFLGDITADRVLAAEAAAAEVDTEPFNLILDNLGYWKHNCILWAGCKVTPPPLLALADGLAMRLRSVGFNLETRAFAAHVTLLRNARCAELPPLEQTVQWSVGEFVLAESTPGSAQRYSVIRDWPLRFEA